MTNTLDELLRGILTDGIAAFLAEPARAQRIEVQIAAQAAAQRPEYMTAEEVGRVIGLTAETVMKRHVAWGLDKSLALGADNPRFFRSQLDELMRSPEKLIKGRRGDGKVTDFPQRERKAS